MISLSFKAAKEGFFDRKKVQDAVERGTRSAMSAAGGQIRLVAQRSMRRRKFGSSAPGSPPLAKSGELRKFLFYAYDQATRTMVVGPTPLPSASGAVVPGLHEFGGSDRAKQMVWRLGGGGPIRVVARGVKGPAPGRFRRGGPKPLGSRGLVVAFAKLRTQAQLRRADAISQEAFGAPGAAVRYAPRPFMGPALAMVSPALPGYWRNSVRG